MEVLGVIKSQNNKTRKYIMATEDTHVIEAVYVDYHNKNIICFSTQIGCPIQCRICSSGKYIRSLKFQEMIRQCMYIISDIKNNKPILLSAMGVGEPTIEYDRLLSLFAEFDFKNTDKKYRFAFSTMLPIKHRFLNLISELGRINLYPKIQISLHSVYDNIRDLIFNNRALCIEDVKIVAKLAKIKGFEVEFKYYLMEDLNDSLTSDALKLVELYKETEIPIKINQFNDLGLNVFRPSNQVDKFVKFLKDSGVQVEKYQTNGYDIKGACDQLMGGRYIREGG